MHRYLQNNICYFRSPISPWTGPQWNSLFWAFFSTWSRLSPYQKSASAEAPFNLFWTLTMILAIFAFWKSYEIFLVQNLGHNLHKKCKIVRFGNSLSEKQPFTFGLFLHLKILLNSITYSGTTRPFGDHNLTTLQPLKIFAVLHVFLVPIISCYDKLWGLPRRVFTLL